MTTNTTELIICTSCRPAGTDRSQATPGEQLLEAAQVAQLQDDEGRYAQVRVRGVDCLSICTRVCSVAFQAAGKHSYLFGDLAHDETTAGQLLDCAALHARSPDGTLLRNERPERLRSGILARLPPLGT